MPDNISKLYSELKDTYELGSESDFRKYLSDGKNREALRKELEADYDVGDYTSFTKYLGLDSKPKPTAKSQQQPKVAVAQQQTRQTRQAQPLAPVQRPEGFGELDLQQAQQMAMGKGPVSWNSAQGKQISPSSGKPVADAPGTVTKIDKAIKGDKKAAKESGLDTAVQRMREEMEYAEATGKPLANIVNTPFTAPTAVKDEDGQMLMGQTTDEQRVAQYQQQERDKARKEADAMLDKAFADADRGLESRTLMAMEDSEREREENPLMFALSHMGQQSSNLYQQQQEQALNRGISPEAIWNAVNSDGFIDNLLNDEAFIDKASRAEGMSRDEYTQNVLLPRIAEHYDKYLTEKYDIKGFGDYLIQRAMGSMTGNILSGAVQTKGQQQMRGAAVERAHEGLGTYKPGFGGRLAGEVAMFAPDAPELMMTGIFGQQAAKAVGGGLAMLGNTLKSEGLATFGRLAAEGSPFLAANVGRATKWGGLATNRALAGTGLGAFMGSSAAVQEMNVGDGGLANIGKAFAKGFGEGALTGAILGVTNLGAQTGASAIAGNSLKSKAARAGLFGTAFVAENQLFANMDRFREEDYDWVDSTMDAFYMQMAGKISSGHSMAESMKGVSRLFSGRAFTEKPKTGLSWQSDGFRLDDSERSEIERAFAGTKLADVAANPENVGKILGDKQNISWVTRQKVAGSMGMLEPTRPRTARINLTPNKEVVERAADGELIEVHKFETPEEMAQIKQQIEERRTNDDMLADFGKLSTMQLPEVTTEAMLASANEMLREFPELRPEDVMPGGKSYDMVLDRARETNNPAKQVISEFGQEYGMTEDEVMEVMNKQPIERTDEEFDLMRELATRLHDAAYPKGEPHPAQSHIDGEQLAGEEPTMNPETAASIAQEVNEARNAYLSAPISEEVREGINSLGPDARLDDIYMFVRDNYSGSEVDNFLQKIADYANAKAKQQGFIDKTGANIDEAVNQDVIEKMFHGTIDEEPDQARIITINKDGEDFILVNGNVGTRDGVIIDPDKSSGQIILRGQDGRWVPVKPDANMTISNREPKDIYADRVREGLQVQDTQTAVETGLVKPEGELNPSEEKAATENGGNQEKVGGEAGAENGIGANEPPAAAPGAAPATEPQGTVGGTALSKIPTLKDEKGADVLDEEGDPQYQWEQAPLDDTLSALAEINRGNRKRVTDTVDAMQKAAAKEVEAAEKLKPKSSNPIKIAREQDEIDAQKAEAQSKVDYWTQAKLRLEEVNKAESALNVEPAKNNEPENVVPLQPKAASERPKAKTADEKRAERVKALKEQYGEDFDDDFTKAQSAEELASMYVGRNRTLSREDLAKELGYKLGLNTDEPWAETLLAKKGEGKTLWEVAHAAYESDENPVVDNEGTKMFSDQEIHDALITIFGNSKQKSDIMDYAINAREEIAKAKFEEAKRREAEMSALNEVVELSDEDIENIGRGLPFPPPTEELPTENVKESAKRKVNIIKQRVEEYKKKYETPETDVIDVENDSDEHLRQIYKEMTGEELSDEEVSLFREETRNTTLEAAYNPETGRIYILAHNADPDKIDKYLHHEKIHKGLEEYEGADREEILDEFWNNSTSEKALENKRAVEDKYKDNPDEIKEEYFVRSITEGIVDGKIDKYLDRLSEKNRKVVEEILNKLGYGKEGEVQELLGESGKEEKGSVNKGRGLEERGGTAGGPETVDDRQDEGRPESESPERDEYLKPRNEKEKQIISDVEAKLAEDIKAAEDEVKKAKSAYEKARTRESDKATDMFSDDKAFEEPGQLFSFDEMGGTDRSQEGVNRRTEEVRERLIDAQAKLDKLQSKAEHDSRVRGALDNERRQTSFDEIDERHKREYDEYIKPLLGRSDEELQQLKKAKEDAVGGDMEELEGDPEYSAINLVLLQRKLDREHEDVKVFIQNTIDDGDVSFVDKATVKEFDELNHLINEYGVDDSEGKIEAYVKRLRKKYPKSDAANPDPIEAIEKADKEFKEERKQEQKELGITTDETPEQKADRERAEKLADTPLTVGEVDSSSASDVQKTLAKAYLNGNHGLLQEAAYLNVYNDVRNTRRTNEGDSQLSERGTQLVSGVNQQESGLGRVGERTGELASESDVSERNVGESESGAVQRTEDSKNDVPVPSGEGSNSRVSGETPADDGLHPGSEHGRGSSGDRGDGRNVRRSEEEVGGSKLSDKAGQRKPEAGSDAAINASKQRLAELRKKFKDAGRNGTLSVSLIGMNDEQIGILGEIITESANLGYQYISRGMRDFNEWRKQMLSDFKDWLQEDFKWTDSDVEEYLREVWNCEYNIDGVTRTIGEWASFIGEKELKKVVKADRGTKFEQQKAAESVETKVGDIDNIRESLPFLLPEQQDDVYKAETQFFSEDHQDRAHGNGKGMMFTNGTGTGKTYTGLGIVKRFVKQGKGRVLILTPSQEKVTDWAKDGLNLGLKIEKLDDVAKVTGTTATKSKGKGVVVTTYANARQNLAMLEDCFDLIVYDESHKITEGKEAAEGEMFKFHQMLTNKDVEKSMDRQTYWLPEWIEYRNLLKEREENRKTLDMLGKMGELSKEQEELQTRLNARMPEIEKRFEELRPIMQEIRESKRPQAEIDSKRTKTVFLSATPFNSRENLKYAEGYLFSYPEEDPNTKGTYNHRSPQDAFLEQTFPAGYRWRYGRLESHISNNEALSRQEIDFSDYLQNTLQTMSGRMIASDYDYSRDFPVLTLDHAGRFNQAMSEVYRNKRYQPLAEAFRKSFDYNYSTALFEAMKTSLVNERIKEHLSRGQKVVVFHRRRTSGDLEPPFRRALEAARLQASMEQDENTKTKILNAIKAFEEDFSDMLEWEKTLDYTLPREQIEKVFGKDKVAFFSGAETKNVKHKSVDDFMKDNGGKDIIVIQEASGKEGISLHDQTGEHQRVEINLALPQSPIAFIQIEGRIYRIGQKSNAIFEYPLLGLDLETNLFAQKFNSALGTTENLALGSKARNLKKSIANSVLENAGEVDYERQGLGGKDMDGRVNEAGDKDGFDVSIQDYYGNQKMQRGRDNREGVDYFPTPEPIGYKMVEWGQMMDGETALEPSAGHGAIARYVPETNGMTAIEPSASLFAKLQMRAGGPGRRFEEMTFEDYPLANKHDVVLMNPPYGVGGKTAMEHVAKAFKHLNEGGRVIAIIPDGPAMDKRLEAWLSSSGSEGLNGAAVVVGEVKLPSVAFGRAGTNVRTRVVVIDKVSRAEMRKKVPEKVTVDLSGEESIGGLFDRIRNVRMPERTIDQVAINTKKALKTKKALEDNPFCREVYVDGNYLYVFSRSRYDVAEIRLNLENPRMDNVLSWYKNFKETMEHPEKLEYGKYVGKFYGTGKNKVPKTEAIKDYCQQAIKTLENVTGVTADQMDRMIREQEAERERKRQEQEERIRQIQEEKRREREEKLESIKRNIEEGFTGEGIYNDVEQLKRMVDLYHSSGSGPFEKKRARFNLEQAGFDPETGKKIDKNEPVNARTATVVNPSQAEAVSQILDIANRGRGQQPTQRKADYEYALDKNTRTGEDMHLVSYNGARLSDAEYRAVERRAKALNGYYNRYKRAFHFKTEDDARLFAESMNGPTQEPGTTTRFRIREKESPKKTQKVYKLMRLGDDGKLYPLFIDSAAPTELGKWYDADSPDLSILQKMPSGTFLVDYKNGTYTSMEDYAKEHGMKMGKYPSKEAVNDATSKGLRWVRIEDTARGQRRYGGESRKYMNLGINGSGTVSEFAMRPGWHAGSLPSMRQIGKGKDRNLRDDRFVWVEGEVPADREWQSIADQNPDKDIPTQIPEDGFYMKATNANKAASQADRIGWYVAGAFKANRIMSDVEARNVITNWNKEHPDQPVEYDFDRESGKDFNAETMQLEDRPTTRFRSREADEDGRFDFDKPIRLKEKGISKDLKDIKANKWNLPDKIRDIVSEKLEKYMSDKDGDIQDVDVKPYFGEKGETTAKDALEYISNSSTDEGVKKLASYLLKNIGDNGDVSVKFSENRAGSRGKYYSNNHSVSIRRAAARGADEATAKNNLEQTIIHEIAHAITVRAIENSPEVRKEFLQIYKDYEELREQYGINTGYAAKNPKEFVAEFLGRKAFREALMEIPSNEKGKTFGQKVLDFIKKHILRIKETDTFFKQADDAIKKVMDMANKGDYPYVDEVAEDATTRFRFAKDKEEFDKIREDAVRSKGLVVKGLNDADISITHVDNHEFGDKPIDKARDWANKNLVTSEEDIKNDNLPKMKDGTPYVISKKAIGKYLSEDGMANSDNKDVHLSVLKRLKDVISESIEAEVHPDYPKVDGVRTTEKYNDNALIHRLYGAVEIDGKVYRVKTTMQEFRGSEANKPHSYEVTKIELLDSPMTASESPSVNVGQHKTDTKESTNNSISGAKLLKDVEKSYDSGKKLLAESEKSTFFRKGEASQTPLEADFRRKEEAGRKLAKKLNSDFEAVTELDQIQNKEVRDAIAAGHEVPGWIEIGKDGKKKIFLYLPHVRDTYDTEKTIAHETVGHYGFRELLGEKAYKTYMRSLLFDLKDEGLSNYIHEKLSKNGFDMYRTIDEYLAEAAEKGYGDLSMWQKVKEAMTNALRKVGFTMSPSISDVKYMVWLSKHNLERGNVMNRIEREALLYKLGKERYEAKVRNGEFVYPGDETAGHSEDNAPYFPGEGRTLFRHTPSVKNQRRNYERSLKRLGYAWKEAHVDTMQSAVELMRSISGVKKIEDIPAAENFVLLENQMSSKEEQLDYLLNRDLMEPLDAAVARCLPDMGKGVDEQLRNLQLYMIKKHGLERNRVLFVRDALRDIRVTDKAKADRLEQDYLDTMRNLRDELRNGDIDLREYFDEVDTWITSNLPGYKTGEKDYSGLTSLSFTGKMDRIEDAALIDDVMSTEDMLGDDRVKDLWEKTNAVSKFGLDMEYEGGLDSKDKHDKVSEMFEWYVPLRGYDEKTAEEVYDYLEENGGDGRRWAGPVLMNAKGRESLADVDVFATLGAMSSNAISRSLRNQMKQAFARFIRNHYNDVDADNRLVTELPYLWAEKQFDPATGQEIWVEKFPDIPENATADDIAAILDQYQQDMEAKQASGDAKRVRQNSNIPFRPASKEHKAQHIVDVWINGEKHSFVVNGNPRAAQAINGQLKAERRGNFAYMSDISHGIAKLATSYNPDFIISNAERDAIFSASAIGIKESPKYFAHWVANYMGRGIGRVAIGVPMMKTNLFNRYRNGELNMSNPTDRYFKEFMENGGETGWVESKNVEKWKKLVKDNVKTIRNKVTKEDWENLKKGKITASDMGRKLAQGGKDIFAMLPHAIEVMNERAENMARFTTYMTSRQMGRSITRSVSDAKEVSVNFNRKGAGYKTRDVNKSGNVLERMNALVAARTAQYGQDYIMFYNAGVQGLNNASKLFRDHPIKASTAFTGFALGAFIMSWLNQGLIDSEDEEKRGGIKNPYAELPEYIRRNNLCLYTGNGNFLYCALPIELRAMYGIGDMAAGYTEYPELKSDKPVWQDVMTQLTQVLPIDFMGEHPGNPAVNFLPSASRPIAEILTNKNWYGRPIEKENYGNDSKPRHTRAYRSVNKAYMSLAKRWNAATNDYSTEELKRLGVAEEMLAEADANQKGLDGWLTDPSIAQHLVESYFAGLGKTAGNLAHVYRMATEDNASIGEILSSDKTPILRKFHYTPTEQNKQARTRNKWFNYKDQLQDFNTQMNSLKKFGATDPMAKMKEISVEDSIKATKMKMMADSLKAYNKQKKIHDDPKKNDNQKEAAGMRMDQIMQNTVMALDSIQ